MRRLCDTREAKNLDLALDFLSKIKAHDVLLAHALDGLEKGQESGIIKPTKEFSALFAEFAKSDNADVRKHSQNLATLWGDPAAIDRIVTLLKDNATPEPARIAALQTLRKLRTDSARKAFAAVVAQVSDLGGAGPGSQPSATGFALEMIRAASDLGGEDFPATIASSWAKLSPSLQLAALGTLASRPTWTHAMLDAVAASKISATGFPATVRRQLATSQDKAIRDHAFKVLGAWKDSSDDVKALIAMKKKACLESEPDLAQGKLLFQTTCMVCHTFHGGGQKVGPELIGSGRSNLDALLANVIDPNQIIGNGYENVILSTKDNRTLMGRVTEDTPSAVKLLAIGGAEQVVPRDQIAKLENTHQSLMPMGFGGLPDDQFRNLIWYVLAPPEEGPLTADKKKLLSTSIDAAPAKKGNHSIDWESVSLWNTKWKVIAPEFDRTPIKLAEYHGKTNVLIMHPFEDKKTPAALEQKLKVEAGQSRLKFNVAADDRGDWQLRVVINGTEVKRMNVNHEPPRWHEVTIDLADRIGLEATIRLEAHATDWAWEFSYWNEVRLE
jgi:putative heme-binding domain-containing protein